MSVTTLQRRPLALVELERPPRLPSDPPLHRPAPAPVGRRRTSRRELAVDVARFDASPRRLRRAVRYTRRARLLLAATLLTGVVAAAIIGHPSQSTAKPPASVVVHPGDTLWTIAVAVDGRADPRATVDRIVELNRLPGVTVRPGQRLRIPVG